MSVELLLKPIDKRFKKDRYNYLKSLEFDRKCEAEVLKIIRQHGQIIAIFYTPESMVDVYYIGDNAMILEKLKRLNSRCKLIGGCVYSLSRDMIEVFRGYGYTIKDLEKRGSE